MKSTCITMALVTVLLIAVAMACKPGGPDRSVNMTASEAAAQASELTGRWMECWGRGYEETPGNQPDIAASYRCTPGPGQTTPLVVCYQGHCKQVRWTGQICFPPRKD